MNRSGVTNGLTFKNARGSTVEHFFHRSYGDFEAVRKAWEAGRRHFDPQTETFHAAPLFRSRPDPPERDFLAEPPDYLAEA